MIFRFKGLKNVFVQFAFVLFVQVILHGAALSQDSIAPENALQHYLHNSDTSFKWELKETYDIGEIKAYTLLLTSQKWRQYTWTHQLTIFVPKENNYDGALLFVSGGSVKNGLPNWNGLAGKNKAIVAVIKQTPNEPLYDSLSEDALISYTLHRFKGDGDYTWPLLFPMVKSAVKAMDAIQQFSKDSLNHPINRFVVSGASKRGWTTWLTGANDPRVVAIAPMVIDILNMPVNLDYQIKAWHEYSIQIEDYVKLGIPQGALSKSGSAINTMVDPYSYRKTLTMPKMIFMGTNDEYWVVDAIKNYYDSIQGRNMIHYVPNAGHDLAGGKQAFEGLSAFYGLTLAKKPYPDCSWSITEKNKKAFLKIKGTANILVDAIIWSADSKNMVFTKANWTGRSLNAKHKSGIKAVQAFPVTGFRAFYVDLKYQDPNGGTYDRDGTTFEFNKCLLNSKT
jgi:PhoPQ-activated pathogenicity-related protein